MKNIECKSCKKNIDEDSVFCKYCGVSVRSLNVHHEEKLARIFKNVYTTLQKQSMYSEEEFNNKFDLYKEYKNRIMHDNDYYQLLVNIIFYSGFRAATVEKYLERIHIHFPDYKVVSKYTQEDIEKIKLDPKMIQNKSKIDACVRNAKKVTQIVGEYGSIKNYIDYFEPNSSEEAIYKLKRSLEKNFSFLGGITSYHFMTDIGLNVLKPDRVILRIFKRLGLIDNEKDLQGAVEIGQAFSKATHFPIRFIDIIFVLYGQLNQEKLVCICSEKNPKCNLCGIKSECLFIQS